MISGVITHTLSSGQVLAVPPTVDFGEVIIAGLVLALAGLAALDLLFSLRKKRGN
jgi:hypothetical protein